MSVGHLSHCPACLQPPRAGLTGTLEEELQGAPLGTALLIKLPKITCVLHLSGTASAVGVKKPRWVSATLRPEPEVGRIYLLVTLTCFLTIFGHLFFPRNIKVISSLPLPTVHLFNKHLLGLSICQARAKDWGYGSKRKIAKTSTTTLALRELTARSGEGSGGGWQLGPLPVLIGGLSVQLYTTVLSKIFAQSCVLTGLMAHSVPLLFSTDCPSLQVPRFWMPLYLSSLL